ncbi:MAG: TraB/GumN family protein [Ahrensia sp.]|nr:TraB/GumN family protein [Ahrensia sp.]
MKRNHTQAAALADRASSATIAFLGALHITIFAITFLLAASLMANAQSNTATTDPLPTCQGANLLEQMAANEPEKLAQINTEAAQVPFGEGLLFKLEKEGRTASYLFGTMHMTDPRVISLPTAAQNAFDGAQIIAVESTEVLDPTKAQLALMARPELTMFTDDTRLSDFLDENQKEVLSEGLAQKGMQLALVDRMKPWMLAGMMALPACEMARKQAGKPFLDMALAQNAQNSGKELVGLETFVEQFDAMASLPMEFHVKGLIDTLTMGDKAGDITETMIVLYTQGKTGTVWPLMRAFSAREDGALGEGNAAFEEAMVNRRNITMLERSMPLLERGNAFVAVGALHLPGEKGLAQLYQNAGYTVTRVQ